MKKRKLNSKNPKYMGKNQVSGPEIKEKVLVQSTSKFKVHFVYYK